MELLGGSIGVVDGFVVEVEGVMMGNEVERPKPQVLLTSTRRERELYVGNEGDCLGPCLKDS